MIQADQLLQSINLVLLQLDLRLLPFELIVLLLIPCLCLM